MTGALCPVPEVLVCCAHLLRPGHRLVTFCYPKSLDALLVLRGRRNMIISIIQICTKEFSEMSDRIQMLSSAYFLAYQRCCHCKFYLVQEMLHVVPIYALFYSLFSSPPPPPPNVKSWSLFYNIILSNHRRTGSTESVFTYCRAVGILRRKLIIYFHMYELVSLITCTFKEK